MARVDAKAGNDQSAKILRTIPSLKVLRLFVLTSQLWPTALVEQSREGAKMDPSIMKPMSRDDFVNGPVLNAL